MHVRSASEKCRAKTCENIYHIIYIYAVLKFGRYGEVRLIVSQTNQTLIVRYFGLKIKNGFAGQDTVCVSVFWI